MKAKDQYNKDVAKRFRVTVFTFLKFEKQKWKLFCRNITITLCLALVKRDHVLIFKNAIEKSLICNTSLKLFCIWVGAK